MSNLIGVLLPRHCRTLLLTLLLTASLLLAACGGRGSDTTDSAEAAPTPEAAATPTAEPEPTEEPAPTAEPTSVPAEEASAEAEAITATLTLTETTIVSGVAAVKETISLTATAQLTTTGEMSDTASLDMDVFVGRSVLASTALDYRIRNLNGDNIGEIEDIVVNLADGHIHFVTMRYGGGLFQSAKIFPVPVSAFTFDAENEVLQLDIDEATLEQAPGFERGWPDLSAEEFDPAQYDAGIFAYWQTKFAELPVPDQSEMADVAGTIAKVSDMTGLGVMNPEGERIGEVSDIIINAERQQLSAAVLSFGGFRLIGTDEYVIPYAAFSLDLSGVDRNNPLGTPVLDITQNNLSNAPAFFPSSTDLTDPNWSEPYQGWWARMTDPSATAEGPYPLGMTSWVLDSFGEPGAGLEVIPGTRPAVTFFLERYAGTGGCNWFMGVYTAGEDGMLRINTPATTPYGVCEPAAVMDQEATFMGALANVTEYQIEEDKLVGYTTGNQRMLTLSPAEPVPFEGTPWALRFFHANLQYFPLTIGTTITAQFEGDQISGSAGCNDFTATFERNGDAVTVSRAMTTMKTCAEPEGIMEQEERFLTTLQSVASYVQAGGTLQMRDAADEPVLLFGIDFEVGP